jgi:hypothetical protein
MIDFNTFYKKYEVVIFQFLFLVAALLLWQIVT